MKAATASVLIRSGRLRARIAAWPWPLVRPSPWLQRLRLPARKRFGPAIPANGHMTG
jgi:hypothetical protein